MRITSENWQTVWQVVEVKAEMHPAVIQGLKTPQISTINRGEKTTGNAIAMYEMVVLGILDFFGAEWQPVQIRECAELLFNEYYWFQVAELKHLVMKIKTGTLVMTDNKPLRVYGKFNPSLLMECFSVYADTSLKEREAAGYEKAQAERFEERWGTHDARLTRDSEAYTMNGLIAHEKEKLKDDGKTIL